jgi:2-amino-4-hydroxy-6-hydroxymethyldihydropteridine diphosphokinase
MTTVRAYVGLGANLGEAAAAVRRAAAALGGLPATRLVALSALYRNPPMTEPGAAPVPQPDYVNAVASVDTDLAPLALLAALHEVERVAGRVRDGRRWVARTLDLDLLLYAQERVATQRLTLPHPGVHCRPFVIHPLAEIAPGARIPGHGTAAALAAGVPRTGLVRLPDAD